MPERAEDLGVYLHLAREYERRQQQLDSDRMLLLAGVIAARINLESVAAYCRERILANNPGHQIRRWNTLPEALADESFCAYLKQFRRRYPIENAERILAEMGIQMAQERAVYYDDAEYAAAILGKSSEELDALYRNSDPD